MPRQSAPQPPATNFPESGSSPIHLIDGWVWAPLRGAWLRAAPEELVRQRYIHTLHTRYGYSLGQMAQEKRTMHGHRSPKADIVVAKDDAALQGNRDYVLVVETKAENVTIVADDFWQGESYARAVGCEFLVAHNEKETRAFRLIPGAPGGRVDIEDAPKLADLGDAKRLEAIRAATKAFSRDEFRKLLHECHTILRDNHKLDPGAAFDEISKVLFIKMFFERGRDADRFTREYLDEYSKVRRSREDEVMNDLFEDTKRGLETDRLFETGDQVNISYATFRRLVEKLERFDLSATSDDIKGIAFEQFLGQTFRGELGQFFTPRPVVDFMVDLLDPQEGELICDPASGTGGFLIRAFDHVRDAIERAVQAEKNAELSRLTAEAEAEGWDEERLEEAVAASQHELNSQIDVEDPDSRLGRLSRECIFGTDAEARAARTSKMNMIMHGDGHGGIYFHDGLLDTGGLLEGRFDLVLTNPPFGASVTKDQKVGETAQTQMAISASDSRAHARQFGDLYKARKTVADRAEKERWPILQMYDIGRDPLGGPETAKVRNSRPTEVLFVERVIKLLNPGGRAAIVLPDGILNNPSLQWLRDYVEAHARLLAVVSLPQSVFTSAKATVKTSIVVLQRLTEDEIENSRLLARRAEAELEAESFGDRSAEVEKAFVEALAADQIADPAAALAANDAVRKAFDGPGDKVAKASAARKKLNALLTVPQRATFREQYAIRTTALRSLEDEKRKEALGRAKAADDYEIFMAEVEAAGITSAGVTGDGVPNELPEVLKAYQEWSSDPTNWTPPGEGA